MEPRPPRTTLSLDLGTDLGWAYAEDGVIRVSGTESFNKTREAAHGQMLIAFNNWLQDWREVDEVIYEKLQAHSKFDGFAAARLHGAYWGVLQMFTYAARIRTIPYGIQAIKKAVTGKGNAKKIEMCAQLHHLGWTGGRRGTDEADDEADACGAVFAHEAVRGGKVRFEPFPDDEE